ncbi:fructose-bisphosphate aldolase [Marinococcus halophilus]|uniref:Fructose-bisphosphate aldolase n=1 Tax=Marinococcus halophilus TaxID=1371 RepID=A0A510Y551_MARHA|nr:class II fructose-bisphosphate aldolase [Marinococcus halophilus]OZT80427.1 fructose-bisphosphate aldolase [Marinococcus halophilus]GEK58496.1 fructose-bisphosphate aldolase [Marinococcus halophilus]
MSLVPMKTILSQAEEGNYGVGSFSVANMEMVIGAVQAAEELKSPLILQVAEVRLNHSPLHLLGPLMVAAARASEVPVAVHLDHGMSTPVIAQALEIGFSSVMYDGSHHDLETNISNTAGVVQMAEKYGATVEAEIGRVGGSEDGSEDIEMQLTSVKDAERMEKETGLDALAVAIGNAHGMCKGEPDIRVDRLREIDARTEAPLVLHGGSGISEKVFQQCIEAGVRKINVATSTFNKVTKQVNEAFVATGAYQNYFDLHQDEVKGAKANVLKHMNIFGSAGKASAVQIK